MDVIAKRRILWDAPDPSPDEEPQNQSGTPDLAASTPPPQQATTHVAVETKVQRNGNGHKAEATRKLNDNEKDTLRQVFLNADGRFEYKQCSKEILPLMGSDISVWQVSGFLSQIHVEVYKGLLQLQNPQAYFEFMAEKYPKIHARYTAKYGTPTQTAPTGAEVPSPKFAQGVPTGKLR